LFHVINALLDGKPQMKPILLILDDWEGLIQKADCWTRLKELVEIKFLAESINKTSDSEIEQVQFLMALRERTVLNDEVFKRMPKLKLVLQTGGHAYHIDTAAARNRNIVIALGRQAKAPLFSVPELTFAFALGLTHKVYDGNESMKKGMWEPLTGKILSGRRLGILGLGRVGSCVANIAKLAFNMEVVAWGRNEKNYDSGNFKRLHLDELMTTSDIISIHLRLSKDSIGLINKERLAKMKPGAILINTSRGSIVHEKDLIEALKEGKIAGAGLDVFAQEPLAIDSPLRNLSNVILTPHLGWTVEEVFKEFAEISCAQLSDYLNDKLAKSEVLC